MGQNFEFEGIFFFAFSTGKMKKSKITLEIHRELRLEIFFHQATKFKSMFIFYKNNRGL